MSDTLKLYLLTSDPDLKLDRYVAAVVVAKNEEDARLIHPDKDHTWDASVDRWVHCRGWRVLYWVPPYDVTARCIGIAAPDLEEGEVIFTSAQWDLQVDTK